MQGRARPLLILLAALSPGIGLGDVPLPECRISVDWKASTKPTALAVVDSRKVDVSRPLVQLRYGDPAPVVIPCGPAVLVWRNEVSGVAIDSAEALPGQVLAVRAPARIDGGALVVRSERTRAARGTTLIEARLKGLSVRPSVSGDLIWFQGLPPGSDLEVVAPKPSCLAAPVRARLTKEAPVAVVEATFGECSELRVVFEGDELAALLPIGLTLRRASPGLQAGPGPTVAEMLAKTSQPVLFNGLAPGDYVLESRIPSCGFTREDALTIPLESTKQHSLGLEFFRVSGTVTYDEAPGDGEITFSRREGARRSAVSAPIGEKGRFEVLLPEPGKYKAQLHPLHDASRGPSRFVDVAAKRESRLDIAFERTSLSVRVVDVDGATIEGARVEVTIRGADKTLVQMAGASDASGVARFADMQPGQGRVTAVKRGYRPSADEVAFQLEKEKDTDQTVVLRKVRTARLNATGSLGEPIPGVDVVCASAGSLLAALDEGQTDDTGAIDIDIEGRLPLKCGLATDRAGMAQVTIQDEKPVTKSLANAASSLNLSFEDQNGKPVAGQVVILRIEGELVIPDVLALQQAHWRGQIRSDGSGQLRLLGLPAGNFELLRVRDQKAMVAAFTGGEGERLANVTLGPGEVRTIVVHLAPE